MEEEVKAKESKSLVSRFFNVMKGAAASTGNQSVLDVVKSIANGMEKTLAAIDKYLEKGKTKGKDALLKGKEMASTFGGKAKSKAKDLKDRYKEKGLKQTLKDESGGLKQTLGNFFKRNKDSNPEDPDADPSQTKPTSILGSLFNKAKNTATSAANYASFAAVEMSDFTKSAYEIGTNPGKQDELLESLIGRSLDRKLKYYRSTGLDDIAIGEMFDKKLTKALGKGYYKLLQEKAKESDTFKRVLEPIDLAKKPSDKEDTARPGILETLYDKTDSNIKPEALPDKDAKTKDTKPTADTKSEDGKGSTEPKDEKLEEVKEKKSLMGLMKDVLNSVKDSAKTLASGKEKVDPKEAARQERKKETQEAIDMQKVRQDRRDKEIADEKEASKLKPKEKKGGGIFGAILSALGAISSAVTLGTKFLLGGIVKMLPGLVWAGVKRLPWLIGNALGGILTTMGLGGISKAGGALLNGAKWLGKRALSSGAGRIAGQAALNVGRAALGVVGFKVVLAATAIYGAYKLYKYLTRNSIGSGTQGTMTRLRLLSYGYAEVNRDHYHKLLEFDMLMKDYVTNKNGVAVYKQFDKEFKDKVLQLFEVKYDDKKKYDILNKWFIGRYLPAHKAFMDAYYGCGGTDYLDNLEKLSGDQVFNFATAYNLPTSVHDVELIPVFDNAKSVVTKQEIDTMIANMRQSAKKDSEAYKGKSAEEVQRDTDKKAKEEAAAKKAENDRLAQAAKDRLEAAEAETKKKAADKTGSIGATAPGQSSEAMGPPASAANDSSEIAGPPAPESTPGPLGKEIDKTASNGQEPIPHAEGEGKPNPPATIIAQTKPDQPLQGTIDKVAKAPGPLVQDNPNLEGIKSNVPIEKVHNLDPNVKKLLAGIAKEYKDLTGKSLLVTEAFRTRADQEALRSKYGNRAAKPGTSLHEFGLAVDVNSPDADALDKMGLLRKYGFTRPVGGEPWHLEPSGVATNPKLAKFDKAARENLINTSPGRGGGGLGAQGKNAPRGMHYKRDMAMQKAIYGASPSMETMVDPSKNLPPDAKPAVQTAGAGGMPTATQPGGGSSGTSGVTPGAATSKPTIASSGGMGQVTGGGAPATPQQGVLTSSDGSPVRSSDGNPVTTGGAQPSGQGPLADTISKPKNKPIASPTPVSPTGAKGLDSKPSESIPTTQSNLDPGQYAKLDPEQAVIQAAKVVGMNPKTMLTFAKIESSLKVGAKNSKSSAQGLFQIVGDTWKDLIKSYGAKYNVPPNADRNNPYYNSLMGVAYAKENWGKLRGHKEAGIPDEIALYLAHHYGSSGGNRIIRGLTQSPNQAMQSAVSADSYRSNEKELRGKTVAQYIEYLKNKFAKADSTSSSTHTGGKPSSADTASAGSGQPQSGQATTPTQTTQSWSGGKDTSTGSGSPAQPTQTAQAEPTQQYVKKEPTFTDDPGYGPTQDYKNLTKSPLFKQDSSTPTEQYASKSGNFDETPKPANEAPVALYRSKSGVDSKVVWSDGTVTQPGLDGLKEDQPPATSDREKVLSREESGKRKPAGVQWDEKGEAYIHDTDDEVYLEPSEFDTQPKTPSFIPPDAKGSIDVRPGVVVSQPTQPTPFRTPIDDVVGRANQTLNNAVQTGIGAANQSISKPINEVNSTVQGGFRSLNSAIQGGVNSAASAITDPINSVKSALQQRLGSISAMGGTPGAVVPAQPRTGFEDLSKPQAPPASIADTIARQRADQAASQPQQPSQALSLDKTESLLSNMGDTLMQIKGILQAIHDKPSGMGGGEGGKQPAAEQPSSNPTPISAPMDKPQSNAAVSMSRRSLA